MRQRPNTKYKPVLITNIRWIVTSTGCFLGAGINLPDYILNKTSIWSMYVETLSKVDDDNLGLFLLFSCIQNRAKACETVSNIALLANIQMLLTQKKVSGISAQMSFKVLVLGVSAI